MLASSSRTKRSRCTGRHGDAGEEPCGGEATVGGPAIIRPIMSIDGLRGLDPATLRMLVDVDGVLTDRDARPDAAAIALVVAAAERGATVTLVTGRSRTWLETMILPHVHGTPRLRMAAEYGAVHADGLGAPWRPEVRFDVPTDMRQSLADLATAEGRGRYLEWDATKEHMATVEARHGDPADDGHRDGTRQALGDYQHDAEQLALPRGYRVTRATYAVDVTAHGLTKRVGAEWALEQLVSVGSSATGVVVLGDSGGDVVMARAAVECGFRGVWFVWLGEAEMPSVNGAVMIRPSSPFGDGTREALGALLTAL
jgi:hypothetical protein